MSTSLFALNDSWIYKVTVLADLISRRVAKVVNEASGLNLSQWRVIAAVADQQGRTASQVVELTPMDKAIVSRAVQSLTKIGLLERKASKEDGRLSHLFLTRKGRSTYQKIVSELDKTGASGRMNLSKLRQDNAVQFLDALMNEYAPR